ncbi:hypothetical protein BT93_E2528 [Corymbia citriodora subsp. variegata]|nr:hypothetical protein BT93_E2528 [Corymbia citriodora subsp. variegata]
MSLFSSLFSSFSDRSDSRVICCEGEDHLNKSTSINKDSHVEGEADLKKNSSKRKSKPPPIPMAYFPIGSNLSRL